MEESSGTKTPFFLLCFLIIYLFLCQISDVQNIASCVIMTCFINVHCDVYLYTYFSQDYVI